MARPLKNNAEYFSHDAGMRNHRKIKALRKKFGHEGYSVWCMILELLTSEENFRYKWDGLNKELAAGDFDTDTARLEEIVNYLIQLELITHEDGFIFSVNHIKRFNPLFAKRERDIARYQSKKDVEKTPETPPKQPKPDVSAVGNTSKPDVSADGNTHSKVKESKGNNREEKTVRFYPPSISEIQSYFTLKIQEKGFPLNPKIESEKFESFYSSKNWYVGKNKMTDWKKAVSGWIARSEKPSGNLNGHKKTLSQPQPINENE